MTNCTRSEHQKRASVAIWVCVVVLAVGLMRPSLGKHHYGEFYRTSGCFHGPNRHVTLDITDGAPDLQPLDLGWTAHLALVSLCLSHAMDHWQALDPIVDEAPPGSLVHRKIGSPRTDDPDLLA